MRQRIFTILLGLSIIGLLQAQSGGIGINTSQPQGVLHIDPNGDTSGSSNVSDDVIISSEGQLGIGVIAPQAQVDINGTFQLNDGTQGLNKALISDASGKASWTQLLVNPRTIWRLTSVGNGYSFTGAGSTGPFHLPGTSSLLENNIAGFSIQDEYVIVPPGRYLVMLEGGLDSSTLSSSASSKRSDLSCYGRIALMYKDTDPSGFYGIFAPSANGSTFIYNTKTTQTVGVSYATRNISTIIGLYKKPPHYNAWYTFTVTFIKL